jgi:hypothetical protein
MRGHRLFRRHMERTGSGRVRWVVKVGDETVAHGIAPSRDGKNGARQASLDAQTRLLSQYKCGGIGTMKRFL